MNDRAYTDRVRTQTLANSAVAILVSVGYVRHLYSSTAEPSHKFSSAAMEMSQLVRTNELKLPTKISNIYALIQVFSMQFNQSISLKPQHFGD